MIVRQSLLQYPGVEQALVAAQVVTSSGEYADRLHEG